MATKPYSFYKSKDLVSSAPGPLAVPL